MFTQVNRTLDRSQGGLGIGLALARQMIQLHGGTISAQSPGIGKGSTFTVRLPVLLSEPEGTNLVSPERKHKNHIHRRPRDAEVGADRVRFHIN